MSDPRRLWQSGDASTTEREALRVAREIEPPQDLRDDVWHGLVAAIPPLGAAGAGAASMQGGAGAAASGTASSGAAASGVTAGGAAAAGATAGGAASTGVAVGSAAILPLVKIVLVGAVLGGAALGTRWIASTPSSSSQATTTAALEARHAIDLSGPSYGVHDPTDVPARGAGVGNPLAPNDVPPAADQVGSPVPRDLSAADPASPATLPRPAQGAVQGASAPRAQRVGPSGAGQGASGENQGGASAERAGSAATGAASAQVPGSPSSGTEVGVVDAREESRMVARARESLRAGNPTAAIQLLDQVRIRYPSGVLVQEREALAIEALVMAGKREVAADRARAFVRTWPESPYVGRVRALTDDSRGR